MKPSSPPPAGNQSHADATDVNSQPVATIRGIPEPEVGLYPFWFWNGDQQEDELIRQLRLVHASGCKGIAIHARRGNRTPYISDRWFSLIRLMCDEARKLGLKIWVYDEDGYPSGNAGWRVQKTDPAYIQQSLQFGYEPSDPENPAFAAFDPVTWEMVDETQLPAGTELLRFRHIRFRYHVDTLNPDVGRCFVSLTHEEYGKRLSGYFSDVIQAFYTDDQCFTLGFGKLPWSESLDEEWTRRYGDDLRPHLVKLLEEVPGCGEFRVRFYDLVQELFLKNFIAQQQEWCEAHGLLYTGHLSYDEGPLRVEIPGYGSSMPYYRLQTIPAIDDFLSVLPSQRYLSEPFTGAISPGVVRECRYAPLMLFKKVASIAHQFANDLISAEVLTALGWGTTPAFADKQMRFEIGMGVNLITPHAFYYTLGRGTLRDCPPSYFFQQPCFPYMGAMFAAWTRMAQVLRRGTYHAPLLLLRNHRLAALQHGGMLAWAFDSESTFEPRTLAAAPDTDAAERVEVHTVLRLHRAHVGFDFGEETVLARDATITPEGHVRIGRMTYSAVMLPPLDDLEPATTAWIEEFQKQGGTVIPHGLLRDLAPDIDLRGEGHEEILVHTRDTADGLEYFLVNVSGRTLHPEIRLESDRDLYDPTADCVVHTGTTLPGNFEFPDGSAFFLLTPGVKTCRIPFGRSVFAVPGEAVAPEFMECRPLRDNLYVAFNTNTLDFVIEDGASVHTLYCEDMDEHPPALDGAPLAIEATAHHPADTCYTGTRLACAPGRHQIKIPEKRDLIALEGDFRVDGKTLRAPASTTCTEGDLAAQGFPCYWGEFEYRYEFSGRFSRIEIDMAAGIAQVSVNGTECGIISGNPFRLDIADACRGGTNQLVIRFANIARNFVTAGHETFGIKGVRLD